MGVKIIVVAVRDQAVAAFSHPWYAPTRAAALRHFADAVNNPDPSNQWRKHPDDYSLHELGTFDTHTGLFETGQPDQIVLARDVLQSAEK